MSGQNTSHHSRVLTLPQSTDSAAASVLVDSHLHAHHQHHHQHNLRHQQSSPQELVLRRRRRVPRLPQSVSAQQLSPPSPPPRHQRQQIQQQLQLEFQEQFEQQSLQNHQWQLQVQQWQQQAQQWQQCQMSSLSQEHHRHHDHGDEPRLAVNDRGASNFPNNLQRRASPGSFSPSQLFQSAEVNTQAVQQEHEYITSQVQQNDTTQYLNLQFSQQNDQQNVYKLFDDDSAVSLGFFSRGAPAKESDAVVVPTTSFSYFNHNSVQEQSTLLSELSLDFLSCFEQLSLDGEIDFLKISESIKEDKVKSFSYFTTETNANSVQPTINCTPNDDSFINPLDAAPDICLDARPGSAYYEITISTRSDAVLNESRHSQDRSPTETSLCELNKLQVFSEIQNLELLTSPKFNDFPQDLKEYLRSERMILADVRSIIASENSDILQSCNENNEEKKATVDVRSLENKTYANILQSGPRYDLNSSPTSDEHSCDMKPLQATRRYNRRSKSTNSGHNVNEIQTDHNEASNSALALETRKRTKAPYKFRKQSNYNKNSKIYDDSWQVETLSRKKRN